MHIVIKDAKLDLEQVQADERETDAHTDALPSDALWGDRASDAVAIASGRSGRAPSRSPPVRVGVCNLASLSRGASILGSTAPPTANARGECADSAHSSDANDPSPQQQERKDKSKRSAEGVLDDREEVL